MRLTAMSFSARYDEGGKGRQNKEEACRRWRMCCYGLHNANNRFVCTSADRWSTRANTWFLSWCGDVYNGFLSFFFYILTTTCKGFIFDQMIQQQQQQQQQDLVKPSFISVWLRKDKLLTKRTFISFILFCFLPYLSLRPSFPLLTCLCTRTHVNFIYHYLYVFCIKPLHSFIVSCLNCLLFI